MCLSDAFGFDKVVLFSPINNSVVRLKSLYGKHTASGVKGQFAVVQSELPWIPTLLVMFYWQ